jgi:osmoprotectant transport system permease protein
MIPTVFASTFGDAIKFIFEQRESVAGTVRIGGLGEIGSLTLTHLELSLAAVGVAILLSVPLALWLGHVGRAQFLAVSVSNVGRAVPAIALVAFFIDALGATGFVNIGVALCLLAVPPLLTNTYVGVRSADRVALDAARGMGLSGFQILRQIELPLALPTMWAGLRIAVVSVIATATIAPLASVDTLGRPIINSVIYGDSGRLGACIVIAVLTLVADGALVLLQQVVTPKGVRLTRARARSSAPRLRPTVLRRSAQPS